MAGAMTEDLLVFAGESLADVELVGGKGASLLELARAGFPVPPFFVLTTNAWRQAWALETASENTARWSGSATAETQPQDLPPALRALVASAYGRLGGGAVAVRSSAVAEDSHDASFAGQQETILGVEGLEALVQAILRCWASAASERAQVYRSVRLTEPSSVNHPAVSSIKASQSEPAVPGCDSPAVRNCDAPASSLPPGHWPMAVVVQQLIEAEVAGVLFTRDPTDTTGEHVLIEAAWGLGEGVVSGKVMPDRYRVRRQDGEVVEQQIADKSCCVRRNGLETVPESLRSQPCLTPEQLSELTRLALQVEQYYGEPRDIEWALAAGRFWLLQARPITTVSAWERESYRRAEITRLRQLAEPRGTVWARYNLAESLTVPTPMTWAVLQRFMSGRGGYGQLLRDVGFDPDPRLDELGFLDLVAGRPYVNLSREPWCYFRHFPFWYPFASLKAEPTRALYPRPQPDWSRLGWRFWLYLPWTFWKMLRQTLRLHRLAGELPELLRREIYPEFARAAESARRESLRGLSDRAVWERFRHWENATLIGFARQALQPTVVLGQLLGSLEQMLRKTLPAPEAANAVRQLLVGVRPDAEADVASGLEKLRQGKWSLTEFVQRFGHRGELEMELAQPRWEETPHTLLARLQPGDSLSANDQTFPVPPVASDTAGQQKELANFCSDSQAQFERSWQGLVEKLRQSAADLDTLRQLVERVREFAALRETSRHYLLLGYSILRQCLVELGSRWHLGDGIFYLTPEEIERLIGLPVRSADSAAVMPQNTPAVGDQHVSTADTSWHQVRQTIRQRRRERQIALTLEVPTVLFSDDLEALGRPIQVSGADTVQGIAVSPGVGEGPALVLREPRPPGTQQGYVLVCPSTDPAWMPLFLQASALVMETGGVLSHGAIVAREFGLPAVVGIPDACQRFRTGQRLRVNGNTGEVQLLEG
jgi:phosphohistidine swiveling domain-containing protein